MNWLTTLRNRMAKAISSDEMRHAGQQSSFLQPLDSVGLDTMANEVGDGTSSDVLMTPVRWLQRAITQAPLIVVDEEGAAIPNHALQPLLSQPNEFYSMAHLLSATVFSLILDGNSYWLPAVNGNGRTVEFWYAPHYTIKPKWPPDGSDFISHYLYTPQGGEGITLLPSEVIHFREGLDPSDNRLGLSVVKGLLLEIWTDNEAARFTASLLRNGGVPGLIVSPKGEGNTIDKGQALATEAKINAKVTREGRGRIIVMEGETRLEQFGFNPQQLDLAPLRNVSEERVTAAVGVPAAVVGFGAGLQQTKVGATMKELRRLAWDNGVLPLQRVIDAELERWQQSEFKAPGIAFDNSKVNALQESADAVAARVDRLVRGGILTRAEAKAELGFETVPADDVYLMPISTVEVQANTSKAKLAPVVSIFEGGKEIGQAWGDVLIADLEPGSEITLYEGGTKIGTEIADAAGQVRIGGRLKDDGLPRHEMDYERWWKAKSRETKHHGSLLEERIIETAPRRDAPPQALEYANRVERIRAAAPARFEGPLMRTFERLGEIVSVEVMIQLDARGEASAIPAATKQLPLDIDITQILKDLEAELVGLYGAIAKEVGEALGDVFGIEFVLSESAEREVLLQGGLRVGLLDLESQVRDDLFDSLEAARAEGLVGDALARRIRDDITAGPWRDVATRARVIARTEGANAANWATLQSARSIEGVERVMVHDNRTGYASDEHRVCANMDGRVVTIQQAEAMGLAHPNCTRSFTPLPAALIQELGL